MLKELKKNKKGFTLAELLIVVAIIAVLVAISIPIFTSQLEKSRDAVTIANLRSAYAEASAAALTGKFR
ncbi:MAG: type IV pilin protein [Blautia faecis]